MQPADLEMEQGATFRVSLQYEDADLQPISVVGYRAHMQVRYKIGSPVLIDLTTENGGIVLGGAAGTIEVRAGATLTRPIVKHCVYDLHLIDQDDPDEVIRVFGGAITLVRAVTVDV